MVKLEIGTHNLKGQDISDLAMVFQEGKKNSGVQLKQL